MVVGGVALLRLFWLGFADISVVLRLGWLFGEWFELVLISWWGIAFMLGIV